MENKKVSIEEQLRVLAELGIKPKADGFVDFICYDWGRDAVESDPYNLLLHSLSAGRIINDDEWEDNSDDVYGFDTECVEDGGVYAEKLEALSAFSKGAFEISNAAGTVDHDNRKSSVSFDFNQKTYNWKMRYNYDWFDVSLIDKINLLLREAGSSKFFFTTEPDQDVIVLFTTEKIAEEVNKLVDLPFNIWV